MSKKRPDNNGIVYSTDPGFRPDHEEPAAENTPPPKQQRLRIRLDTKQRAGKAVTLVEGFAGKDADLEDLGKRLKTTCGTGGSVKDGIVIIQGDQREKVLQWLMKNGYASSRRL
ncbi:MAG TPA: translation initiation factor [Puia sp.]|nr:translation initiation factor [Puia sp.]